MQLTRHEVKHIRLEPWRVRGYFFLRNGDLRWKSRSWLLSAVKSRLVTL